MIKHIAQACLNAGSTALPFCLVTLLAGPVSAHPGHGADGGSHAVSHYLTTPAHWAVALATGLLVGCAVRMIVATRCRMGSHRSRLHTT